MIDTITPPAERLAGVTLNNGWVVQRKIEPSGDGTGSWFSVCYEVRGINGHKAFLKAMDYTRLGDEQDDPRRQLELALRAFNFEWDVLEECRSCSMNRVVRAIESGTYTLPGLPFNLGRIEYLIFEWAEGGDIRSQHTLMENFNPAWALRCLHNIAVAVAQLHRREISHQDIKHANVLVFSRNLAKLGDLGSAAVRGREGPFDDSLISGDKRFAPPELLYGYQSPDWRTRRFGCDLYQLGSLMVFLFSGVSMNALLKMQLDPSLYPEAWNGIFDNALPFILDAYTKALDSLREPKALPRPFQHDIIEMVEGLCHPDPTRRGHPKNRTGHQNQFGLERYIPKLENLARAAERGHVPPEP